MTDAQKAYLLKLVCQLFELFLTDRSARQPFDLNVHSSLVNKLAVLKYADCVIRTSSVALGPIERDYRTSLRLHCCFRLSKEMRAENSED